MRAPAAPAWPLCASTTWPLAASRNRKRSKAHGALTQASAPGSVHLCRRTLLLVRISAEPVTTTVPIASKAKAARKRASKLGNLGSPKTSRYSTRDTLFLDAVSTQGVSGGGSRRSRCHGRMWTVRLEGGPRRVNHAAVAINGKVYSFGGYCTGEDYNTRKPIDVHVLNTVSLRWALVQAQSHPDDVPFQRYGHTVVAYGDYAYLWGGRNDDGACNILYRFDTNTLTWSRPRVCGHIPGARDGHSACVMGPRMYIFGGFEEQADRFSQDVHYLDLDTMQWQYVPTRGPPPQWRDFHSATALGGRMYVWGGRGDSQGPYHSQSEVYCNRMAFLDVASSCWVHPRTEGQPPEGRRSHSAFVYNGELYVFGGYNGLLLTHFGDMHKYDPENSSWSQVKIHREGPCARRRQCCCMGISLLKVINWDLRIGYSVGAFTLGFLTVDKAVRVSNQIANDQGVMGKSNGWVLWQKPPNASLMSMHEGGMGSHMMHGMVRQSIDFCLFEYTPYDERECEPISPTPNQTGGRQRLEEFDPNDLTLMDHSDLHVLDFAPTLKTLCLLSVIDARMDISHLPQDIRWEISAMTTNNSISRPLQTTG
ncbi:hypothetical protein HPB48_016753 [Haemaphysalis longicornis]|uniref:Kelch repeat protein n=1 Tax=Haemaphysalis longicornis TaxID=44386 RepID=A0A9J6GM95_HAELO|nr:hypothetical protein HPB48_016753 [Haemaphysalis longicornis]